MGAAVARPARAPTWLFGALGGVQVWGIHEDPGFRVGVTVGALRPIILLNLLCLGTAAEGASLRWAMARLAIGRTGYWERTVSPDGSTAR